MLLRKLVLEVVQPGEVARRETERPLELSGVEPRVRTGRGWWRGVERAVAPYGSGGDGGELAAGQARTAPAGDNHTNSSPADKRGARGPERAEVIDNSVCVAPS